VFHWLSFEPTFEKIEALFFSEIFWKMTKKIIFRVLAGNCKKARLNLLQMFWRILDKNLSHFANISSEEIDFEV
jgi:hypothetical protein